MRLSCGFLFALLLGSCFPLSADVLYSVTYLGTLGGPNGTYGNAINDAGQITGDSQTASSGAYHAFTYSNGVFTDLGTLPGGNSSAGYSINNAGQIVGGSDKAPLGTNRIFLYSNGQFTDLGPGIGYGINNAGQITGYIAGQFTGNGVNGHAFLYSNGVMTDLGTLPGGNSSEGYGINNAGQIVGSSYTLISYPGYNRLQPSAILYSNGVMTYLGTLPGGLFSDGFGINDAGQIVGDSNTASGPYHAILDSNGVMTDLNSLIDPNLQITLTRATGINNLGQIVADGAMANGNPNNVYLLTPVPEPGTWALLGVAGLMLAAGMPNSPIRSRVRFFIHN